MYAVRKGKGRRRFELIIHTMCTYTDVLYLCGCCGPPVCNTSCSQVMSELDRINHPEAWEGEGLTQLPFDMADECMPSWHNALLVSEAAVCNHYLGDGCLPEQRVPEWLASYVAWMQETPEWSVNNAFWPEQPLEWLGNNVEGLENQVGWLEYDVGGPGFDVQGPESNVDWLGYNFALPEYNSAMPEYDPARPWTTWEAYYLAYE